METESLPPKVGGLQNHSEFIPIETMIEKKPRAKGVATVETNEETGVSYIVLKVGPFKDRRAALRKLTDIMDKCKI